MSKPKRHRCQKCRRIVNCLISMQIDGGKESSRVCLRCFRKTCEGMALAPRRPRRAR